MKFITAFFMAWGNFITLPCPSRKWDGKLKNLMLAMLPSVGIVVGVLFFCVIKFALICASDYQNHPALLLI